MARHHFVGIIDFTCHFCRAKWPITWLGYTWLEEGNAKAACLNCTDTLHETILDEKEEE